MALDSTQKTLTVPSCFPNPQSSQSAEMLAVLSRNTTRVLRRTDTLFVPNKFYGGDTYPWISNPCMNRARYHMQV